MQIEAHISKDNPCSAYSFYSIYSTENANRSYKCHAQTLLSYINQLYRCAELILELTSKKRELNWLTFGAVWKQAHHYLSVCNKRLLKSL